MEKQTKTRISKGIPQKRNNKLTNCRTCEKEISKNAETCPHCGDASPLNAKEYAKSGLVKFIATIVMAFILYQVVTYQLKDLPQKISDTLSHKKK